jgi:hypothetical protein
MNRQRDDDYGSLRDLLGSFEEAEESPDPDPDPADPADADVEPDDLDEFALPPGLPPEYVEAFRRGYERARSGGDVSQGPDVPVGLHVPPRPEPGHEPTRVITRPETGSPNRPEAQPPGRPEAQPAPPSYDEEPTREGDGRKVPPAAIALFAAALVLVAGAFGIGRMFADDASSGQSTRGTATSGGQAGGEAAPYEGPVASVRVTGASATCQGPSSVDAAGNPVTYEPAMVHDGDHSTAWRCNGRGRGQRLTVSLPEGTVVAEVGLVPGYAKTDPVSGADRYAENNRITRVRWRFDDGSTYVQRMRGGPDNRSMRTMRVPETATSSVVIEILRSQPGPRNRVAISEVRIASPSG